jgi:nucleotide-binding universal stress UspA family protein
MLRNDSTFTTAGGKPLLAESPVTMPFRAPGPVLGQVFPLLLALAADEPAAAMLRLTLELSLQKGAMPAIVRALGEVRDAELTTSWLAGTVVEEYLGEEFKTGCRQAVERQMLETAGAVNWPVHISDRSPIDAIVERARELRAGLIVMGLRHHGVLQRAISRELLGEVVRVTRVPVLGVRPGFATLPKRIVVAIDFNEASIRAARIAQRLMSNEGALYLVHVSRQDSASLRTRLDVIVEELSPSSGVTLTPILLHGDVQSSIESIAQAVDADLLAVGNEAHSVLDRLTTGSMSMRLAHTARWSTLVVPSTRE